MQLKMDLGTPQSRKRIQNILLDLGELSQKQFHLNFEIILDEKFKTIIKVGDMR